MRNTPLFVTASTLALLFVVGSASAQSPALTLGNETRATLNSSDPTARTEDDEPYSYKDYTLQARAGQRLEVTMRSEAFDTYLQLLDPTAADAEIASDDDGLGEGTDSRLRFTASRAGAYTLRARTLSGTDGGDFTLALRERPPAPRTPRPGALRLGSSVTGTLDDHDAEADDGATYDAYIVRASAGQRLAVTLKSGDGGSDESDSFDPVVKVGRMQDGAFVELVSNDDGGDDGLNSYLVFTVPEAGDYVVRATSLNGDGDGAYTLSLAEGPAPLAAEPIVLDQKREGDLTDSDGRNDTGSRADAYRFSATPGQRIEIKASSDAFDTVVELFDPAGTSLAQNDDDADGTNSRLVHTLDKAGDYIVQVHGLDSDSSGKYSVSIGEVAPDPEPSTLAFGREIRGEIVADGPRDDEGRGFIDYVFSGKAENRAQIVMQSGDFDTYLQISRAGGDFEALASDDDGLGEGTDSRLIYSLPATGDYVVRASPLGGEEKGLFSIQLTDRGPQPANGSVLLGATARGTLTDADAVTDEGAFYDAYEIKLAQGDKIRLTLVSNDFDAFLDLGRETDGKFTSLETDDDGLSDTHARLDWTATEAGTYVIRARSFDAGKTGGYVLTTERQP